MDYKRWHAKATLQFRFEKDSTVATREALAFDACASEFEAAKVTEAVYRGLQEKGRNVRAQLDALRSINANTRASITWAHGEGG